MPRFFVDSSQISGEKIYITGDDVKHISRVLRLRTEDCITVCDKCKTDYDCKISEISPDRVVADIVKRYENRAESDLELVLYQGLPKSDKMDYIVQKCVEMGVSRVVPVITKRAVSRPSDADKKISRWQKIAAEAAKQSGRGIVPDISDMLTFEQAIREATGVSDSIGIMPYECEMQTKLREVLLSCAAKRINILIGPEGGFDELEVSAARNSGIKTVTLGPRIMRTETAPIAVCAAVMYELGDW